MGFENFTVLISSLIPPNIISNIGVTLVYTFTIVIFFIFIIFCLSFFLHNITKQLFFNVKNIWIFILFTGFIFISTGFTIIFTEALSVTKFSIISLLLYILIFSVFISFLTQEIGRHLLAGENNAMYSTVVTFFSTLLLFSPVTHLYDLETIETIRLSIALIITIGVFIKLKVIKVICDRSEKLIIKIDNSRKKINKRGYIDASLIFRILLLLFVLYVLSRL